MKRFITVIKAVALLAACVVVPTGYFACWWQHSELPSGYGLRCNGSAYRYYDSNTFLFNDEWGSHWTERGAIGAAWFDHRRKDKAAKLPEWKPID